MKYETFNPNLIQMNTKQLNVFHKIATFDFIEKPHQITPIMYQTHPF